MKIAWLVAGLGVWLTTGAAAQNATLTGTVNPVPVTLTIGDDSGTVSVTAVIASGLAMAH